MAENRSVCRPVNKVGFSIIVFGLIVMLIAVNVLSETLGTGLCVNKVEQEVISPNGQLKAVLFTRDCAGTPSANVSVIGQGDALPNKPGNVLVGDPHRVGLSWEGDQTVVVRRDSSIAAQTKLDSVWIIRLPLPQQVGVKYERR